MTESNLMKARQPSIGCLPLDPSWRERPSPQLFQVLDFPVLTLYFPAYLPAFFLDQPA